MSLLAAMAEAGQLVPAVPLLGGASTHVYALEATHRNRTGLGLSRIEAYFGGRLSVVGFDIFLQCLLITMPFEGKLDVLLIGW